MTDFGQQPHLDQRQVRRLSDKGLRTLAWLIATNWPTHTIPRLAAAITYDGHRWLVMIATHRPHAVQMRTPRIEALTADTTTNIQVEWRERDDRVWLYAHTKEPVVIVDDGLETSLTIVWRGELWPRLDVTWRASSPVSASESLGNKLMLRLRG